MKEREDKFYFKFRNALIVAGIYLLTGVIWIYISDQIIFLLFDDLRLITSAQTYKGWFFIIITSFLLFFLVYRFDLNLFRIIQLLRNANSDLRIFFYHISHEIRTPISSSLGLINIAKMSVSDSQCEEYLERLKDISAKADASIIRMMKLPDIISSELIIKPIDFNILISASISELQNMAGYNETEIITGIAPIKNFRSDQYLIKTILVNLLENSVRYRKISNNGKICIGVKQKNGFVKIKIEDNGIGMEKESLEKIFNAFYKGTVISKGIGLGLYIVKLSVQRLKGKIEVSSKPLVGTTVELQLPSLKNSGINSEIF